MGDSKLSDFVFFEKLGKGSSGVVYKVLRKGNVPSVDSLHDVVKLSHLILRLLCSRPATLCHQANRHRLHQP